MGETNLTFGGETLDVFTARNSLDERTAGGLAGAAATNIARVLVSAHARAFDLKAELDKVKKLKDELAELTIKALSTEGVDGVKIGGFTVSAFVQIWPKFKDGCGKTEVCEALEKCGSGDMVALNYNANSLAGLIREMADPESGEIVMPDDLAAVLTTSEVAKISIKKSKA